MSQRCINLFVYCSYRPSFLHIDDLELLTDFKFQNLCFLYVRELGICMILESVGVLDLFLDVIAGSRCG